MDVKWLDDFLVLADCRSFTAASRLRNTSQSGLSRRIQSLEQWAGVRLVDREAHPLQLTEAGLRFLPVARDLRRAVAAARLVCREAGPGSREAADPPGEAPLHARAQVQMEQAAGGPARRRSRVFSAGEETSAALRPPAVAMQG